MKKDDVIYVKEGKKIVSRGIVQDSYTFDSLYHLRAPNGTPWSHQVPVKWDENFAPIVISLGRAQQYTVERLSAKDSIKAICKENEQIERLEGEIYRKEALFRKRNSKLIETKKVNSDYCCEVCGFSFEKKYGPIGKKYIIAHHLKLIAAGSRKTLLKDIALLCANCHAMIHTKNPPISVDDLRDSLKSQS